MPKLESSNISSADFNAADQTLDVTFKKRDGSRGATYRYSGVTQKMADDFFASDSFGRFLEQVIKPGCPYERLPEAGEEG